MVSNENYFDKILTESNKLNEQNRENPEEDDPILTAYLLQLRAANWFANNPGSVLLNSAKYSGCKDSTGKKQPLGGPIDEQKQNYRNRQGSTFCSDEYPFWECQNKKKNKKKVNIVIDEEITKTIDDKPEKENDPISPGVIATLPGPDIEEEVSKKGIQENFSRETKINVLTISAVIIFFIFILGMSYLIAYD